MTDILDYTPVARLGLASRLGAFAELTKPRVSSLVLAATAAGFWLADPSNASISAVVALIHAVMGTALVAGGANTLNQYLEVEQDGRMDRTCSRPIPSGRVSRSEALLFGLMLSGGGVLYLFALANPLAAGMAVLTLLTYVLAYTPLKPVSSQCVLVGAVPGALPTMIGWAAATGSIGLEAWLLFAIVFFWQLPHVVAIAWLYRDDYALAGFHMTPLGCRSDGTNLRLHLAAQSVGLVIASVLPVVFGVAGLVYLLVALTLGVASGVMAVRLGAGKSSRLARDYVRASVVHLPVLLAVMLAEKVLAI